MRRPTERRIVLRSGENTRSYCATAESPHDSVEQLESAALFKRFINPLCFLDAALSPPSAKQNMLLLSFCLNKSDALGSPRRALGAGGAGAAAAAETFPPEQTALADDSGASAAPQKQRLKAAI